MCRKVLLGLLIGALLFGAVSSPSIARQELSDGLVLMRSDGSLFLLQDGMRYRLDALRLPDERIDAVPEAGSWIGRLRIDAEAPAAVDTAPVPATSGSIIPSAAAGLSRVQPIPIGQVCQCGADRRGRISTFNISIDEVVADAWPLVRQANRFNPAPDNERGYLAVKISLVYLSGPQDSAFVVNSSDFKLVGSDNMLRGPASILEPDPRLAGAIYPGATLTGYVVYEVPRDEAGLVLLWETNYTGERGVWFALG